jgi:transcriptional regulator with XRE-family HTH domain
MTEFESFINTELDKRGWTAAELARRAGVTHATLSHIISGKNKPGPKLCNGIARAFGIPSAEVFRIAGLQPSVPETKESEEELLFFFRQLNDSEKNYLTAIAKTFFNMRRSHIKAKENYK